jgi:hypothetical protein
MNPYVTSRAFLCLILSLFLSRVYAQPDLFITNTPNHTSELKETKMLNPIAFFEVEGDTIYSYDFENLKPSKPIHVKLPMHHQTYAYGYIYFNGVPNPHSQGMMNLLLCDYKSNKPILYIDQNNNGDFTDDDKPINMPRVYSLKDTVDIFLSRLDNTEGRIVIKLSRMGFYNKASYRDMLNEYYHTFYPNRKFIGIDYCLREQRLLIKWGILQTPSDSFKIALLDANSNGIYNEAGIDKFITINLTDSFFDASNELQTYTIPNKKEKLYFDKNGISYLVLSIDEFGRHATIRSENELQSKGIEPGKKAPNIMFYDWEGKKYKLKKFRKKQVFIYLSSQGSKDFASDTATLRIIADKFEKKIHVIGFVDVAKSYELRIFGTYANLNWIAAFKDKYLIRDLQLKGIPCSLLLDKKNRVIQYNMTPKLLLELLEKQTN